MGVRRKSSRAFRRKNGVIIGVDPGCTGALAALRENGSLIETFLMPTMKVGTKTRVNGAAVAAWLSHIRNGSTVEWHAYLEQVNAMPSGPPGSRRTMGVASAFTFGHAAGLIEGVLSAGAIPLTLVPPQAWKKHAGLIGKDKDAARTRAIQLFPECRVLDLKAKGQAVADALLIARYGIAHNRNGSI